MDRTNAERQRRYIANLKAVAQSDAALKARIAELEAELTRERAKKAQPFSPARKQAVAEERKAARAAARAARAAAGPAPDPAETIETLREERDKWKAEVVKRNTRIRNLEQTVRGLGVTASNRVRLVMSKRLHREIRAHLHPDRVQDPAAKKRADKCLGEFNGLTVTFIDE
jgi:hypothetical protein